MKPRLLLPVFVALLAAFPAPAAAVDVPDPMTCAGYPQPRLFLESQSWWRGTPVGDTTVRHVHSGACFPYRQTLDGQVTIDVVSMLHEYEGWMLRTVRIQAASDQDGVRTLKTIEPKKTCTVHDCTFVTPVTVDVSGLGAGVWEFRVHSEVRQNATSSRPWNLATNGWLACVKSCSGRTPQAVDPWQTEGRGYYKTSSDSTKGYVNGRFLDALPWNPTTGELEQKSGTWCPNVRTLKGAGDEAVSDSFMTLDPRLHADPPYRGRVLLEQRGTFSGPMCIDTTQLADGRHKLLIQASWESGNERLSGTVVVPFAVNNGTASPPPAAACSNGVDDDRDGFADYPADAGCTSASDNDESNALAIAAPTIIVTKPTAGEVVSGTKRLNVSASSDVLKVEYLVDGMPVASDDTPANGFDETWSSTSVPNGPHAIAANAYTASGSARSATVEFTVKN
jgi:hypothetical protein